MIEQVEILKDHTDLRTKGAEMRLAAAVEFFAFKPDVPAVGRNQAVDALEQGAFSGAGRADQHLELAAFYGKAAILQNGLAAQLFGNMGNLQDVFGHGLSFAFKAGHSVPGGVAGNLHGVF